MRTSLTRAREDNEWCRQDHSRGAGLPSLYKGSAVPRLAKIMNQFWYYQHLQFSCRFSVPSSTLLAHFLQILVLKGSMSSCAYVPLPEQLPILITGLEDSALSYATTSWNTVIHGTTPNQTCTLLWVIFCSSAVTLQFLESSGERKK